MTTFESLTLNGCAPTPLASYLKGLGILRLISSDANHVSGRAADPDARGWWENESFHLTTKLSDEALIRFFLDDYAPSPIIAPWNGGSGFYPNDNKDGFEPLTSETIAKRFKPIANAIQIASSAIEQQALTQRPEGDAKIKLVGVLRATLPDPAIKWLDAALALSGKGLAYPQLLGTGGNDGRLDFTNNFMRRLVSKKRPLGIIDATSGKPLDKTGSLLSNALHDTPSNGLNSAAIGQFAPAAAGGPNATAGFEADANVNPWDFVLMLEGAAAFAGGATRRHQGWIDSGASFPFTVRSVGAGWGGIDETDENDARAEFWAPLWRRPASFREIVALLAEGRAVLNGRTARDGLDFARAVASLGVSRGFSEFQRYGFLMRSGKAYLATPMGRRSSAPAAATRLVADLDANGWLDRVRRVTRNNDTPAVARNAIKRFEDALFEFVKSTAPQIQIERPVVALGEVCIWLAVSRWGRDRVTPPPLLSSDWIRMADDGSAEFRIAAALAGLGLPAAEHGESVVSEPIPEDENAPVTENGNTEPPAREMLRASPMAVHFAPIDEKNFFYKQRLSAYRAWSSDAAPPTVVWGTGSLISNMIAVLERRLVDAAIRGLGDKPLAGAIPARLSDVAMFLSGDFDDERCAALLRGLVWAQPPLSIKKPRDAGPYANPPFAYAALKPIFVPDETLRRIGVLAETARMPVPPGLTASLRTGGDSRDGRVTDTSVRAALSRARASGLPSPFDPARSGAPGVGFDSGRIGAGVRSDRLAASLLIPVSDIALRDLLQRVYPSEPEGNTELMEDPKDGD